MGESVNRWSYFIGIMPFFEPRSNRVEESMRARRRWRRVGVGFRGDGRAELRRPAKSEGQTFAIGPTTLSLWSCIIPLVLNLSSLEHQDWVPVQPGGASRHPVRSPLAGALWWCRARSSSRRTGSSGVRPPVAVESRRAALAGRRPRRVCSPGTSNRKDDQTGLPRLGVAQTACAPRTIVISASAVPRASWTPVPSRRTVSPISSATTVRAWISGSGTSSASITAAAKSS